MKHLASWTIGFLALLVVVLFQTATVPAVQSARESSGLSGTVISDRTGLEGVAVSARASGATVTTTVFTGERGMYSFPTLPAGKYHVWAQAVGYATERGDATLGEAPGRRDFTLHTIDDVTLQVSGSEWIAALPAATREQRRMREIFRANCTMCHTPAVVLQQRFDEQGWRAIIDFMLARFVQPTSFANPVDKNTTMVHHRDELAKYLAAVRGPDSPPLKFTPQPRPTGEAARVVITEWDIPFANHADGLAWFDGSDWSEGAATSGSRDMSLHDVVTDNFGNAWLTSFGSMTSTIYKLDIRSGQVTGFNLPSGPQGRAQISHGLERDATGILWFDMLGDLGRIDPATETLSVIRPPSNLSDGANISVDASKDGKVWASTRYGAVRYDPETKEWLFLQNASVADGLSYGNAVDADGNGWWAQFQADRLGKGDPKTGKSWEVFMRPPWVKDEEDILTPEDKKFYKSAGALTWGKINSVPGAQAPRRMASDKNGDSVWAANFLGQNLARVNMRTLEAKFYRVPVEGHPYDVDIDRDHNAWTNLHSDDRILKLNPKTGQWTVFRTPGNGCETRHIHVDQLRNEVWVPCHRTGKVVRMQFRTSMPPAAATRPALAPSKPAADPGGGFQRVEFDMKRAVMPSTLSEKALRGRKLFTQRCAACHDPSEVGTPYGPRLASARIAALGEAAVRARVAEGSKRMPGFRHMLSPEQVGSIFEFLHTR